MALFLKGIFMLNYIIGLSWYFPGKESACNSGDSGSIPGPGRSPGEGIGHPPQYS